LTGEIFIVSGVCNCFTGKNVRYLKRIGIFVCCFLRVLERNQREFREILDNELISSKIESNGWRQKLGQWSFTGFSMSHFCISYHIQWKPVTVPYTVPWYSYEIINTNYIISCACLTYVSL